jgi:hypothetical protein
MARPKKRGLDYIPFDSDFFDDEKIKRLKRRFKETGSGHAAIARLAYIKTLTLIAKGNGYYVEFNDDFIWDIADEMVCEFEVAKNAIDGCLEVNLFDRVIFDEHTILTSRGIQERYLAVKSKTKATAEIESRFCAHETLVNSEKTLVNSEITPVNSELMPLKEKEKINVNVKEKENKSDFSFSPGNDAGSLSDWDRLLAKWKTLEGSPVKVEVPTWLIVPQMVSQNFLCRTNEYGIERILEVVDLLKVAPYWQNRKIGIGKFLQEDTFLKLHEGGYGWNPDVPDSVRKKNEKKKQDAEIIKQMQRVMTPQEPDNGPHPNP